MVELVQIKNPISFLKKQDSVIHSSATSVRGQRVMEIYDLLSHRF